MKRGIYFTGGLLWIAASMFAWYTLLGPDTKKATVPTQRTVAKPNYTPVPPTNESLLAEVNAERARNGVAPLIVEPRLKASAQAKACDQRDNNYYAHTSPSGIKGRDTAYNAMNQIAGNYSENLFQASEGFDDTRSVVYGWIGSPSHHAAMISSKYTHTGFGICGNHVVEHFYGAF